MGVLFFLWVSFCNCFLIFWPGIKSFDHVYIFCCVQVCIISSTEGELGDQGLDVAFIFQRD